MTRDGDADSARKSTPGKRSPRPSCDIDSESPAGESLNTERPVANSSRAEMQIVRNGVENIAVSHRNRRIPAT